jgi:DNA invertase Pin-like site-specific DNA recombinase
MPESKPQNRRLGYARVSTYGQTLDAQLDQLRKAGCSKIFREKVTGARADRRELLKLLKAVAPGDVVTVTRIDRLARSTFDLFAIVKQIVDAKGQFRWHCHGNRPGQPGWRRPPSAA